MMGKRFARIVEECLHRLDRGEYLPDVLADFPAEAERLKPLLLVAMASRSMAIPVPDPTAHKKGREQMLSEMDRVETGSAAGQAPTLARAQSWITKLLNTSRARSLIRSTPSYRLAMITLVVIFGAGWFVISASASPGVLFQAISDDFQQVLAFLYREPSDAPPEYFQLISINEGGNSPLVSNQASKAIFLRDLLDANPSPERSNHPEDSHSNTPSPDHKDQDSELNPLSSQEVPDETPVDMVDDNQGPGDLPVPSPHPAAFVVEVVSDTAKEKNPVWDQLPFNQSNADEPDDQEGEDIDNEDDKKDKEDKDD